MKYIKSFKIFERSSLTPLGVPEEIMKEIQINFEIETDSSWTKIRLKKDVLSELRKDEKQFFIQISKNGNIMIFINNHKHYIKQYFKLETDGWGSFRIDEREHITFTQLSYSINIKDDIYMLDNSNFKLSSKKERKLSNQINNLEKTTEDFKLYILTNFNKILQKIYGKKHKEIMIKIAKNLEQMSSKLNTDELLQFLSDNKKLAEIAKEYEKAKEDNDILNIKRLEKQYNSLSILDEYLIKFETEYSEKFNFRVNIEDLIETFGRMPIETAFMYFLYTGRIKDLMIRESNDYDSRNFEVGDYIIAKFYPDNIGKIVEIEVLNFIIYKVVFDRKIGKYHVTDEDIIKSGTREELQHFINLEKKKKEFNI